MSQLMLISNPKKRTGTKHRTAAQRAATKKMIEANRRRRGTHSRRRNPVGLARVHRTATTHRRRRRNPIRIHGAGTMGDLVMAGFNGAVGSVAVNAVTSYLPATITTGKALYATRAGLALLIGTMGRKVIGKHARQVAEGALAVNFADLINSMAGASLPGSVLHGVGGVGKYLSAYQTNAAVAPGATQARRMNEMGEYVS